MSHVTSTAARIARERCVVRHMSPLQLPALHGCAAWLLTCHLRSRQHCTGALRGVSYVTSAAARTFAPVQATATPVHATATATLVHATATPLHATAALVFAAAPVHGTATPVHATFYSATPA